MIKRSRARVNLLVLFVDPAVVKSTALLGNVWIIGSGLRLLLANDKNIRHSHEHFEFRWQSAGLVVLVP